MGRLGNADVEKAYTIKRFELGATFEGPAGKRYVFCKYNQGDGAVAGVAGYVVVMLDNDEPRFEVTADLDSATIKALRNLPVGILSKALTDGQYGWVQYFGINKETIPTDAGVSEGELLIAHATQSGTADSATGPSAAGVNSFGVALDDDDAANENLTSGEAFLTDPLGLG